MDFIQRHPLEDLLSTPAPASLSGVDHISVLRRPAVLSIMAAPEALSALPDGVLRIYGPSECLLVLNETELGAVTAHLKNAGVPWVDQSHAYVVARLSGPNARAVLAKGTAVDLHPAAFSIKQSTNTLYGQVRVNLTRIADDAFEIVVPRSYARFFFEDMLQAGRSFSLTAAFAQA